MEQQLQDRIRYFINQFIYDRGYAPTVEQLADLAGTKQDEVTTALDDLVKNHSLVLHPNSHRIWIAHPFSLMPTMFWVEGPSMGWYSNCTWCALGVASLVTNGDVTIYTKLNGTREVQKIHVENGNVVEDHLLVHFLVPPQHFWDNVIYTCSNMLTFDSEQAIEEWCKRQNVPKTEVQPIGKIWNLAKAWYGYYLSPQWTRKTTEQARAIFKQVGLESEFWHLS